MTLQKKGKKRKHWYKRKQSQRAMKVYHNYDNANNVAEILFLLVSKSCKDKNVRALFKCFRLHFVCLLVI